MTFPDKSFPLPLQDINVMQNQRTYREGFSSAERELDHQQVNVFSHLISDGSMRCGERSEDTVEEVADSGRETHCFDTLHVRLEDVLRSTYDQLTHTDGLKKIQE